MKCPKCGYLGFDNGDRCKNCGYEFSLITPEATAGAIPETHPSRGARFRKTPGGAAPSAGVDRRLASLSEATPMDLPLFGEGLLPPPRAPLSVRRATPPSRTRVRSEGQKAVPLELNLEMPVPAPSTAVAPSAAPTGPVATAEPVAVSDAAPPSRRLGAAAIDALILAGVDALLLWFALRLCGLNPSEISVLPVAPLVSFLVLLNAGYSILYTGTLGQTLGKMAVGIRVVPLGQEAMDLRRATWRATAMLLSIGLAGLGFLPAAFGDFRTLHDRLAGTRVIRHAATWDDAVLAS
jgi:uncharacterized RDD family membrane protein YckC